MSSQSQSLITVTVDGQPLGIWDTRAGGATTASLSKRRPGGTQKESVSRARPTTEDITVSREYQFARDAAQVRGFLHRVGRAPVTVSEQPLDDDDIPFGAPTVFTGVLSGINRGDVDSNSDDFRMVEITVVVESVA